MPAPESWRLRPWIAARLTSSPHPVSKAVHSPPHGVTVWCPLQLISHLTHLETQREVGSASASSALLAGALQAYTSRLCPSKTWCHFGSPRKPAGPFGSGGLIPLLIGLLLQLPHTYILVTMMTELLGLGTASCSAPIMDGPKSHPCSLISAVPWAATLPNHT